MGDLSRAQQENATLRAVLADLERLCPDAEVLAELGPLEHEVLVRPAGLLSPAASSPLMARVANALVGAGWSCTRSRCCVSAMCPEHRHAPRTPDFVCRRQGGCR